MRRRQKPNLEGPGQDSFLDIVANLVGILIILVMVVGVRAKDAMVQAETEANKTEPEPDVVTPSLAAKALIGKVNAVQVATRNLDGTLTNRDFHLTVTC